MEATLSPSFAPLSETDDISEAAFRYMFFGKSAYYLAIIMGEKKVDPDDALLKRFADHKPPVKKVSECTVTSAHEGVRDKETGEHGLIFRLGEPRWTSDKEVEIDGGYYESGLAASGNTYYLKKEDGKWKVYNHQQHWIS
jgi:hypothetical protein